MNLEHVYRNHTAVETISANLILQGKAYNRINDDIPVRTKKQALGWKRECAQQVTKNTVEMRHPGKDTDKSNTCSRRT